MNGNFLIVLKKWCVLAVVVTLALSLTSCGKKKSAALQDNSGYAQCDGVMGSFDISTVVVNSQAGLYQVKIQILDGNAGDQVAFTFVDSNTGAYQPMQSQVVIETGNEVSGTISQQGLQQFDTIAITPIDPGGNWAQQSAGDNYQECTLPAPGAGTAPGSTP